MSIGTAGRSPNRTFRLHASWMAAIMAMLIPAAALAAATWLDSNTEHPRIGGRYTWNYGSAFGTSQDGRLHASYATDRIGGTWASDGGRRMGVYYLRGSVGSNDVVSWSGPKRLNPTSLHAERPSLTASASNVYAIYVTQRRYDQYDPRHPRVLFFRANTSSGAADAWLPPVRLSPLKGRVDYPVIAAHEDAVYAIWTNSNSGEMVFGRSSDKGATWSKQVVDSTTKRDSDRPAEGYAGWPGICANGTLVGLTWLDNPDGKIVARVSEDGGVTFGPAQTLAASGGHRDKSWPQCASYDGVDDRVVFTWTNHDKVRASMFVNSSDSFSAVDVYDYDPATYNGGYGATPSFSPDGTELGIAFTGCRPTAANPDCDYFDTRSRVDLLWVQGGSDGSSWSPLQVLARKSPARPNSNLNDYPGVVWYDADTRFVTYNTWTPSYVRYQVHLQTGKG